jgi:hypothetical protein
MLFDHSLRDCLACGDSLSIDIKAYNYPKFVGLDQTCSTSTPTDIDPSLNINWKDFVEIMNSPDFTKETAFVDVRPQTHYSISHVGDAVNIPVDELELMDDVNRSIKL